MAADLPSDFDVIVVGTGMPESILAAAFSRIGQQVLHLDKNEYYSGQWASFNLEGIEKWSRQAKGEDQLKTSDVDTSTLLEDDEQLVHMSLVDDSYSNISITFHAKNEYYSGQWASFNLEGIEKWSRQAKGEDQLKTSDVDTSTLLKDDEQLVHMSLVDDSYSNISITFHAKDEPEEIQETVKAEENAEQKVPKESSDKCDESEQVDQVKSDESLESCDENKTNEQISSENSEQYLTTDSGDASQIQSCQKESSEEASGIGVNECDKVCEQKDGEEQLSDNTEKPTEGSTDKTSNEKQKSSQEQDIKEWTKSALKKDWRKFNLDLAPKLLYCRGSMVELLITSDIAKYCEFKTVTRMLTLLNGKLEKVPCSRADVFASKNVSMLEKRMLMKFLTFCNDYQNQSQEWIEFKDRPFIEFLIHKKLTNNIKHFIQHSIAMVTDEISTEEGLSRTQKFLHSLGRYGNTAFLWSLYGSGEMPQSFCRMCAVFGGLYCLRMSASSLIIDKDNRCSGIITTEGQRINCKQLIIEKSSAPKQFVKQKGNRCLSRAILITDKSILLSENQEELLYTLVRKDPYLYGLSAGSTAMTLSQIGELSLLRLPVPSGGQPITVLELPPSSMVCPPGLYVVQISRDGTENTVLPEEDLSYALKTLFNDEENKDADKPNILWSLYYSHAVCEEIEYEEENPENVIIVPGPGPEIDTDKPVDMARKIFEKVMPDEDFIPRPPNPEDIIYVDESEATVGGENSQSDFSGSGDQSDSLEQKNNDQSETLAQKTSDQSEAVEQKNLESELETTEQKNKDQSETSEQKTSDQSESEEQKNLES